MVVSAPAFARSDILRGGFGLLFPDANSFINPGEAALGRGLSLETGLETTTDSNNNRILNAGPSAVYGGSIFSLGGYYQRAGDNILGSPEGYTERVGAALGLALLYKRLTIGATYSRETFQGNAGANLAATATARFGHERVKGVKLAVSANQDLGIDLATTGFSVAVGYDLNYKDGFELNISFNDFYNPVDWSVGGYLVLTGESKWYTASGLRYDLFNANLEVMERVGYMLSRSTDCSLYTHLPLATGSFRLGATLRQAF